MFIEFTFEMYPMIDVIILLDQAMISYKSDHQYQNLIIDRDHQQFGLIFILIISYTIGTRLYS